MIKKYLVLIGLTSLLNFNLAHAASPILSIMPSVTATSVSPTGSVRVVYTVQNQSSRTLANLSVIPAGTAREGSVTVENNSCNTSLPSAATCTFSLKVQGADQASSFELSPRVCAHNGALCSVTSLANRTQVITLKEMDYFAYFSIVSVVGLSQTNASTVVPVHASTLELGNPIGVSFSNSGIGNWGQGISVSPDGGAVYVVDGAQFTVLSGGMDPQILSQFTVTGTSGYLTQVLSSPDGKKIYATSASHGKIYVINNEDGVYTQGTSIDASGQGLAMTKDGSKLFSTDYWADKVYVIDTATPSSITSLTGCGLSSPYSIAGSADGKTIYAGNWGPGVSVFKYTNGAYVCDTSSSSLSGTEAVSNLAISPNGQYLYVVSAGYALYVVNTQTNEVIAQDTLLIPGIYGLAITPDGKQLFLSADTSGDQSPAISPAYVYTINDDGSLGEGQSLDVGGNQDTQGRFAGYY